MTTFVKHGSAAAAVAATDADASADHLAQPPSIPWCMFTADGEKLFVLENDAFQRAHATRDAAAVAALAAASDAGAAAAAASGRGGKKGGGRKKAASSAAAAAAVAAADANRVPMTASTADFHVVQPRDFAAAAPPRAAGGKKPATPLGAAPGIRKAPSADEWVVVSPTAQRPPTF